MYHSCSLSHAHAHTHPHSRAHTHPRAPTHSHAHTHTHTHSLTHLLMHARAHSLTLTCTGTRSLSHTHFAVEHGTSLRAHVGPHAWAQSYTISKQAHLGGDACSSTLCLATPLADEVTVSIMISCRTISVSATHQAASSSCFMALREKIALLAT